MNYHPNTLNYLVRLKNLGTVNKNLVLIGNLELYFSYETIVAFSDIKSGEGLIVCENVWSTTTGKFLNELEPDKSKRMKYDDFKAKVETTMELCNLKES